MKKVLSYTAGCILITHFKYQNQELSICNIYAPNDDTPDSFYQSYRNDWFQLLHPSLMIAADFNLVLNPELDRKGPTMASHGKTNCLEILQTYMEEMDLCDISRLHITLTNLNSHGTD